ncbi:Ig-like domain-containing protein [Levilactobacillus zymae]|uniref:Ig-like domain-containing protein n=1 Tax=Levilactobacillus zymae TaxID=267363 RepID=UPI000B403C70|nr:Ig-like domain-containing protein [Levilactobacillus zymae]
MRVKWVKVGLLSLLAAIIMFLNVSAVKPAQASTLADGEYTIPATLVQANGSTSSAAKFFANTAQVTVTGDQAQVSLAMQNHAEMFIKAATVAGQSAVSGSALTFNVTPATTTVPVTFNLQIPQLGAKTESASITLDWQTVPVVTPAETTTDSSTTTSATSDSATSSVTSAVGPTTTPTATKTTTAKSVKTVTQPRLTVKTVTNRTKTVTGLTSQGAKVVVKRHGTKLGSATANQAGKYAVKLTKAQKAKTKLTITTTKAKISTTKTVTVRKAAVKKTVKKAAKPAKQAPKTPTGTWKATGTKGYTQVWTFTQKTGLTQKVYRHGKAVKTRVAYATYHVTPKTTTFWKVTYAPRKAKKQTLYLRFTTAKQFKLVNAQNHVIKAAATPAPATTWTFNRR